MELVDTHCHIHFDDFIDNQEEVIQRAAADGVTKMIAVGCSLDDSKKAVAFASNHRNIWASVGAHPHDGADFLERAQPLNELLALAGNAQVVAIGEIGLDYFKNYVDKDIQIKILRQQIEATLKLGLPYIFHIREAFADFWPIFDSYSGITGVVHSFSDKPNNLAQALDRGLSIGLNGIMTFSKMEAQLEAAKMVPLDSLLLETDAPFLAPKPYRGQTCEPRHVRVTAEFLAELRGESLTDLAAKTTANAEKLFKI